IAEPTLRREWGRVGWAWPSSICIGALDRPDGGDTCNPCRLRDLRAVHEPDREIAAGITPENVGLPVAVEVSGSGNRPHGRYTSDADRLHDLRTVHQPDRHVAAGVMPENIALAVAVEVRRFRQSTR